MLGRGLLQDGSDIDSIPNYAAPAGATRNPVAGIPLPGTTIVCKEDARLSTPCMCHHICFHSMAAAKGCSMTALGNARACCTAKWRGHCFAGTIGMLALTEPCSSHTPLYLACTHKQNYCARLQSCGVTPICAYLCNCNVYRASFSKCQSESICLLLPIHTRCSASEPEPICCQLSITSPRYSEYSSQHKR